MAPKSKKNPRKPPSKRLPGGAPRTRQAREQEQASRALKRRLIVSAVLLVVGGTIVFFAARPKAGPSVVDQLQTGAGSCRYDTTFDGDAAAQFTHVANPTYKADPPAGGAHTRSAANPGFYERTKVPSNGELVHAMQHGFVVLWVKPDLAADKQQQVSDLSDQFGRELIVVPRKTLAGEVAVTSWHKRLLCGQLAPDKVSLFTRSFSDQGPEKGFL